MPDDFFCFFASHSLDISYAVLRDPVFLGDFIEPTHYRNLLDATESVQVSNNVVLDVVAGIPSNTIEDIYARSVHKSSCRTWTHLVLYAFSSPFLVAQRLLLATTT
jgi:hypothetical protein